MQTHQGMRIVHDLLFPWVNCANRDANFLLQLAPQRGLQRFATLDLAARKLPIARIDLAFRPRGHQKTTLSLNQDTHRYIDDFALPIVIHALAWEV